MVAFIVGISDYYYLNSLPNAEGDAEAMKDMFEEKGVQVFSPPKDPKKPDNKPHYHIFVLQKLWKAYLKALEPGDIAFIFFAGHGCAWKNKEGEWLQCLLASGLTKDEKLLNDVESQLIEERSLQVPVMLDDLEKKGIDKHVILTDCCRTFKYKNKARGGEKITDARKGDFNIEISAGTLIGFAASLGGIAYDGKTRKDGHGNHAMSFDLYSAHPFITWIHPHPLTRTHPRSLTHALTHALTHSPTHIISLCASRIHFFARNFYSDAELAP